MIVHLIFNFQFIKLESLPCQFRRLLLNIQVVISFMKITQKHLFLTSLSILLLTLFTPQTLLMTAVTIYLLVRLIKTKYNYLMQQGIISFLPLNIRNQLINRSLFDWLCDFWFMESLNIIKVCVKPFITQVEPEDAEELLNDLPSRTKQIFMTKGIVNILPEDCKNFVLPQQNENLFSQKQQKQYSKKRMGKNPFKTWNHEESPDTEDQDSYTLWKNKQRSSASLNNLKTMKRIFSDSQMNNQLDIDSPLFLSTDQSQSIISFSTKKRSSSKKWDKLEFYNSIKSQLQNEGIVKTAQNVMSMVKKVIQLKNLSESVHNINSQKLVKVMIFFWIVIIIQIKLSPYARKMIFKALYAICGTVSVIGALSTSVFILYKFKKDYKSSKKLHYKEKTMKRIKN